MLGYMLHAACYIFMFYCALQLHGQIQQEAAKHKIIQVQEAQKDKDGDEERDMEGGGEEGMRG